ncbi:MAG: hypothetical protein ACREVI_16765 [Steroidobacteraceae bacterium]
MTRVLTRQLSNRISRLSGGARKLLWLVANGAARDTTPVYVVGSQRSGTHLLGTCLGKSPEFRYIGEANPAAFVNFSLRDDAVIQQLILDCKYRFLVLRPLKDSHRVLQLLALNPASKTIWAYRNYLDRVNSAVRMFKRHPLHVFSELAKGNRQWQTDGMTPETEEVVKSFNVDELSEHDGAALMWWLRNSLYFSLDLGTNIRVRLWSYDAFIREPQHELGSILDYLGARYHSFMHADVHAQSIRKDPAPVLRMDVRDLCENLYEQLESARLRSRGSCQV